MFLHSQTGTRLLMEIELKATLNDDDDQQSKHQFNNRLVLQVAWFARSLKVPLDERSHFFDDQAF